MTPAEFKTLQRSLINFAIRKGYPNEAEDFASQAILWIIEGRTSATNDQLFIDYLRKTYGRSDKYSTSHTLGKSLARHKTTTDPIKLRSLKSHAPTAEQKLIEKETRPFVWQDHARPFSRQAEVLSYIELGYNLTEIASILNVTQGRISQIMGKKKVNELLAQHYLLDHFSLEFLDEPFCIKMEKISL